MCKFKNPKIVFMTGGGPLYWITANALVDEFGPITIIREKQESKKTFLSRRIKKLGLMTVTGQIAFSIVSKFLNKLSSKRRQEAIAAARAKTEIPAASKIIDVESVNSEACLNALESIAPDVVFVAGTRMINKKTLNCIDKPVINYHPGLTQKYRGMNGAYWTLANRDTENLAATVHLVDENVDTGDILYQEYFEMPPGHNVTTYAYVMAVKARDIAVKSVEDALDGKLNPVRNEPTESSQWYHPTLWGYLWTGVAKGVW